MPFFQFFKSADDTVSARKAVAVTTSDVTLLPVTRGLFVGVGGNLNVQMVSGDIVLFTAAAAGYHPLQVTQVLATSTTATNIVALY